MPTLSRAAALVAAMILAGCGSPGTTPSPAGDSFDPQGSWELTSGTAKDQRIPILDDHPITLTIEGSEIGGTSACNSYGGRLTVSGGQLEISELGMTAMGCEAPAMAAESAYVAALGAVRSIAGGDELLVLRGPGVELRFERLPQPRTAELVDTAWVLDTVFVGDVASSPMGDRATLELSSDGTFTGSTGCRAFSGEWIEAGEQIVAPMLEMDPTECPADLRRQDDQVVSVIGDGFVPSIEGNLLTLTDPGGIGLVYRSEE
jgi:heat shock protein HslJ